MGSRGVAFLRKAICGLFLLVPIHLVPAQAQSPELDELYKRGVELYQAGKYAEAVPIAEQYIKVAAANFGEDNPVYASGLGYLGVLDQALNRTAEAEGLFKRALGIKEKALGPDHKEVAEALLKLAEFYRSQGQIRRC
jgi:tetratricopeptide (TPR) repeat protein